MYPSSFFLPVRKVEVVQIGTVGGLLVVSIQLVVDGYAPPARRTRTWRIVPVDHILHTVQRNALKQERIIRFPLYLDCDVVPAVVHGVTGVAARDPPAFRVVPGIPFVARGNLALSSPNER